MPAGLQCWDANGKLIVDIGDYNTRFIGTVSLSVPGGARSASLSHSEATKDGCFAVIINTSRPGWNKGAIPEYVTRCLNGSIVVYAIPAAGGSYPEATTLTINLYGFL